MLGLLGAAAAAAPAAAIDPNGNRGDLPNRPESEAEKRRPRYRETDHVRAFYRTNRS
ncbi:hypothetical protein [Falsiroseomonas oryziterrae]|uniref:hypothetical protein n=1 Tax=Falsiroseomonas oryziterrae TaxID=2911368 RepID=UPI001F30EF77|nr:hypothetical protein [Roseomonas sp. NPKOSM-4]